jgi:hypothetical protein
MDQLIPILQILLDGSEVVGVMWVLDLDDFCRKRVLERLGMSEAH